jgi:hypothetical protein|tara:strand:- start:38 stop:286 length:249 start_codon:yes stop_codon:yes gene_type:complete
MAFDKNLDKEIFAETVSFETTRIKVGVYSYNEGDKKLQISRENMNQDMQWNFSKLGRMFKDEVEAVAPLLKKALEHMKDKDE